MPHLTASDVKSTKILAIYSLFLGQLDHSLLNKDKLGELEFAVHGLNKLYDLGERLHFE